MWPKLLDMSREESKRILRRLELEAYSSVISAFRAHGDLTKDKKKILFDLQHLLSISTERHRAEVRRAVNDEKLTTIADGVSGPNISSEWLIEGRRLIPLMPRLVPQTAFTGLANNVASAQAERNASMVPPYATCTANGLTNSVGVTTPTGAGVPRPNLHRPSSPTSNIVVLPSGMSIRIEGGLNTDDDDEIRGKKRRRSSSSMSSSIENLPTGLTSPGSRPLMQHFSNTPTSAPMKITFTKSPQKSVHSTLPSHKVILVSTASSSGTSVLQKTVAATTTTLASTITTSAADQPKTSIILPQSISQTIALTSTTPTSIESSFPLVTSSQQQAFTPQAVMGNRVRPKYVQQRAKTPTLHIGSTRPGLVPSIGGQQGVQTTGQLHGLQIRPGVNKPTIHVKHEGGMKIITHAVGGTVPPGKATPRSSPIVTRPASSPLVVVSNASSIAMVTKAVPGLISTPGVTRKVLNVTSQGAKLLTSTRTGTTPNVVTVNPKTLQVTAVKSAAGGAKPNVIVVQKAQAKPGLMPAQRLVSGITTTTTTLDKVPDLVSFLQKQDSGSVTGQRTGTTVVAGEARLQLSTTPSGSHVLPSVVRVEKKMLQKPQLVDLAGKKFQIRTSEGSDLCKSSILAELIHHVGLPPASSSGSSTFSYRQAEPVQLQQATTVQQSEPEGVAAATALNEWVDYDLPSDDVTAPETSLQPITSDDLDSQDSQDGYQDPNIAAIRSLLKLQSGTHKPQTLPERLNVKQLTSHIEEGQFFNIDRASGLVASQQQLDQSRAGPDQQQQQQQQPRRRVVMTSADVIQQLLQSSGGQTRITNTSIASLAPAGGAAGTVVEQELLGELDPQTGLFYPMHGQKPGAVLSIADKSGKAPLDLFSSALAEAQIDLDPYQFMAEDQESESEMPAADVEQASKTLAESGSSGPQFAVIPQQPRHHPPAIPVPEPVVPEAPTCVAAQTDDHNSLLPIRQGVPESCTGVGDSSSDVADIEPCTSQELVNSLSTSQAVPNVSVAVQPVGLDPSLMNLEDFTSQKLDEPGTSGMNRYDEGMELLGKRKRKAPAALDDSPPQLLSVGSWIRGAMNLIQRVSRYRGTNRERGEINAAAWFLKPVNSAEAPDYYRVIKTPMDFGTIRRKLETGMYSNLDDFHQDMCLIRQNCHQYNPPNHEVRKDCDEVFLFYISEYERLVDRLKTGATSPPGKKPKLQNSSGP